MTSAEIRESIRVLECQQDIPASIRVQWAQDALVHVQSPKGRTLLQQAVRRIKRGGKKAKYPVLYIIQPLVSMAFGSASTMALLDRTILQLRLTTLMRSVDAANIVWAILLPLMEMAGVDTDVFKAHSLRGATATQLLRKGVPHHLVQSRGAWSNSATLDVYYNRLHQSADWERLLEGEDASVRHSADRAVLPSSASQSEPDEGRGSGEDKRASTARAAELDALGIRRPLYDQSRCMSCSHAMNNEAAYRCQKCKNMHHVRCMGHHACVGTGTSAI